MSLLMIKTSHADHHAVSYNSIYMHLTHCAHTHKQKQIECISTAPAPYLRQCPPSTLVQ